MSAQRLTTGFNSAGLSMTRNIPRDNPLAASFLLSARSMTAKGARAGSNAADSDPDSTDTRALPLSTPTTDSMIASSVRRDLVFNTKAAGNHS